MLEELTHEKGDIFNYESDNTPHQKGSPLKWAMFHTSWRERKRVTMHMTILERIERERGCSGESGNRKESGENVAIPGSSINITRPYWVWFGISHLLLPLDGLLTLPILKDLPKDGWKILIFLCLWRWGICNRIWVELQCQLWCVKCEKLFISNNKNQCINHKMMMQKMKYKSL